MIAMVFIILKFVVVAVLLVAMVMVLLGIRHISNPRESATTEETEALKRDVDQQRPGISSHSLFSQFLYKKR